MTHIHHQVQQLRMRNLIKAVESILVFFAALFITALLPSLLVRYVLSPEALLQQPVYLEYIPVVGFVVGVGYFVFAAVGNVMREKQARQMEKTMMAMSMPAGVSNSEMAELESMVDAAMASKSSGRKVKAARRSAAPKKRAKGRSK